MYFFDRKTLYFVWYREDGQARSVGSAQLTVVENVCRIEISVTNCGRVEGDFPCYMLSGPVESMLGMLRLSRGKGVLSVRCEADRIGHMQVPYGKLTGIHIDLKGQGYLEQKWLPLLPDPPKTKPTVEKPAGLIGEIMPYRRRESGAEGESVLETESGRETAGEEETAGQENSEDSERRGEQKEERGKLSEPVRERNEEKQPANLYADKWQQLCAIYPVVHPFEDARGYLSIELKDFVILQERYHTMVQNSFLLHGFYHYRHLLLGRQNVGKEMQYYLGVPGVLHEKERAVALFYGFEGFESARVPAQEGSFGYYMKKVQI